MIDWEQSLINNFSSYSNEEFEYIETTDINQAKNINCGATGIYTEATIVYFEIKNPTYILKENGRRKAAVLYTMCNELLSAIAEQTGGFVNDFSSDSFLIIYPGKEGSIRKAVTGAMKIAYALTETFKQQFSIIHGFEFAMGLDHGHVMGSKTLSDCHIENISWFGLCIYKAKRICKECARPYFVGVSGNVYHSLEEDLKITTRLGIKKNVDVWTKVTYQYENVKKHLYQTNHKISPEEE